MSYKIYNAYRIPKSRLNDYLKWAHEEGNECAANLVRELAAHVKEEALPSPNDFVKSKGEKAVQEYYTREKYNYILQMAIVAHKSSYKEFCDLSSSLNIWIRGNYAYIIPIAPRRIVKALEKAPDYVQEYGWWDNTDRPEEVSSKQWAARRKLWTSIYTLGSDETHNVTRLNHEIIDMSGSLFGFWTLAKKLGPYVGISMDRESTISERELKKIELLINDIANDYIHKAVGEDIVNEILETQELADQLENIIEESPIPRAISIEVARRVKYRMKR